MQFVKQVLDILELQYEIRDSSNITLHFTVISKNICSLSINNKIHLVKISINNI